MLGLSITGIGARPLVECLSIYNELQYKLDLSYLELAIGSYIDSNYIFNVPVVIHDNCLGSNGLRLNLLDPSHFIYFKQFINSNNVLHISIHPPLKEVDIRSWEDKVYKLSEDLSLPIYVELMPNSNYHYSSSNNIGTLPLLLDVSHINIWTRNNKTETKDICLHILNSYNVKVIHLSSNLGKRDSHDLIPNSEWFIEYIDKWSKEYYVTYESLPIQFSKYQRLDKKPYLG